MASEAINMAVGANVHMDFMAIKDSDFKYEVK